MQMKTLIPFALVAMTTAAAASPYDDLAQVEILPGWRTADGDHIAGLKITLAPGWKTYWRAPGDAGIPPVFSFTGSQNITGIAPHWPVPDVFDSAGLQTIGYHDSVVFPLTVHSDDTNQPMQISGQIDIGICEEICIPVSLDFDALLPADGSRDSAITAALVNRPMTKIEAQVGYVVCAIDLIEDGLGVTAIIDLPPLGGTEIAVIETGDPNIWVSQSQIERRGNQLRAGVEMFHAVDATFGLDRSQITITVMNGHQAVEINGCTSS
jgi:DsbC/DsbD-like thiol-disulfide interchange protein